MSNSDEKRKHRRAEADGPAEVEQRTETPIRIRVAPASVKNISAGGVLIHSDKPLPVSRIVLARFALPGEKDPLEVTTRAVRYESAGDGYDIALEFVDCSPAEIAAIEKYIKSKTK